MERQDYTTATIERLAKLSEENSSFKIKQDTIPDLFQGLVGDFKNFIESVPEKINNLLNQKPAEKIKEPEKPKEKPSKKDFREFLSKHYILYAEQKDSILFLILDEFCQMKHEACIASNETLINKMTEYGINIGLKDLRSRLASLKAKGMITIEYDNSIPCNTTRIVNTLKNASTERLLHIYNTFFLIEIERVSKPNCTDETKKQDKKPKENPKKESRPADKHEVAGFFTSIGKTVAEAHRFWHFFNKNGWRIGNDLIFAWKAIARIWRSFKDEASECKIQITN